MHWVAHNHRGGWAGAQCFYDWGLVGAEAQDWV